MFPVCFLPVDFDLGKCYIMRKSLSTLTTPLGTNGSTINEAPHTGHLLGLKSNPDHKWNV